MMTRVPVRVLAVCAKWIMCWSMFSLAFRWFVTIQEIIAQVAKGSIGDDAADGGLLWGHTVDTHKKILCLFRLVDAVFMVVLGLLLYRFRGAHTRPYARRWATDTPTCLGLPARYACPLSLRLSPLRSAVCMRL